MTEKIDEKDVKEIVLFRIKHQKINVFLNDNVVSTLVTETSMWQYFAAAGVSAVAARSLLRVARSSNIASSLPKIPGLGDFRSVSGFSSQMTKTEAIRILNLSPQNIMDPEEIRKVHRTLLLANHPDRGGSTYLSSKVNEAKDLLIGKRSK
jgi:DnaJ homolog subfamily C member 19